MWQSNIFFVDGGKNVIILVGNSYIKMSYDKYIESFQQNN